VIGLAFAGFVFDRTYGWLKERGRLTGYDLPSIFKGLVYAVLIVFMFNFIPEEANPFIYFQF